MLAALVGTSAGVIYMVLFGWKDWRICLMLISLFAVPIWALVLLPMHVLLPRSSRFWHPAASTGVGGVLAVVLLTIFVSEDLLWLFLPIGILVGVITGLAGSAVARLYAIRSV